MLAAVMEMIHTATLVHDDVLDEAKLRRHRDTINARNDQRSQRTAGRLISSRTLSPWPAHSARPTPARRSASDQHRLRRRASPDQQPRQFRPDRGRISRHHRGQDRRARAPAAADWVPTMPAADAELEESLARFGRYLGIAFQIVDDLLDMPATKIRRANRWAAISNSGSRPCL